MSLVLTRPPKLPKQKERSQRVYTLHSSPNNVFAWRLDNERMKTATVVFKRQQDAVFMAKMIEEHVVREKEWPNVSVVNNVFSLYGNGSSNNNSVDPEIIEVRSWDTEQLRIFCVTAYLDIVSLNSVEKISDGFKLNGELITLSVPIEFYIDRLAVLYEL